MKRLMTMVVLVVLMGVSAGKAQTGGPWTDWAFGNSGYGYGSGQYVGAVVQVVPRILEIGSNERLKNRELDIVDKVTSKEEAQAAQRERQALIERAQLRGQIQKLQDENKDLREENVKLKKRLQEMQKQIDQLVERVSQMSAS